MRMSLGTFVRESRTGKPHRDEYPAHRAKSTKTMDRQTDPGDHPHDSVSPQLTPNSRDVKRLVRCRLFTCAAVAGRFAMSHSRLHFSKHDQLLVWHRVWSQGKKSGGTLFWRMFPKSRSALRMIVLSGTLCSTEMSATDTA